MAKKECERVKVLFDCQALDMQKIGGVSRCFAELYTRLGRLVDTSIAVVETDNVYFRQLGFTGKGGIYSRFLWSGDDLLKHFLFKLYYNFKFGYYANWDKWPRFNKYQCQNMLKAGRFDVFHPTFFDPYFLDFIGSKPFVVTVHDMIPELYPQYFARDNEQIMQKRRVIPLASHIIAVSEQTKRDLVRLMKVPEEKVTVIYHGSDETPYTPSSVRPFPWDYLLYVGDRAYYKNFDAFAREAAPLLCKHDLRIVCTGRAFTREELRLFQSLGIGDRVEWHFVRTDQELLDLYHYAVAFVYPSLYEGFGIPILEAWKAGCPVMLNNASCFPEVAGGAAIFFEMNGGRSDFREKLETLCAMDCEERRRLVARQSERLKRFSWDTAARQLAGVYEKVAGKQKEW